MTARAQATRLLAEALMLEAQDVGDDTALGHTAQWDSMAHLRLVLALEAQLGRTLSPEDVVAIADFASVVDLLARSAG